MNVYRVIFKHEEAVNYYYIATDIKQVFEYVSKKHPAFSIKEIREIISGPTVLGVQQ